MVTPRKRITVIDIAREAGVSPATVSKALNDTGQLREATRQKVRETAERLGFVFDGVGRSLASGRTYSVAVLTGDAIGRFSIPIMLGAENALAAGKMLVFLCDSRDDPLREQHYLRNVLERRAEGVIVTGRRTEPRHPIDAALPAVYAYAPSDDPADSSVVADEAEGMRLIVDHLLALGRERIAHITGPVSHLSARLRADAVAQRLTERGLEPHGAPLFGEWSEAWGRAAAEALLEHGARMPDAITCGSDQIARGVTERLRERGVRIPSDIAVTGYDDWDVMVSGSRPTLTTVDPKLGQIGRRAAELLLDKIAGREHSGVERVPPRLVSRASTLGEL
ncbi:LacI family DNA-binding transcriptional regulator [Gryllotalpicola ginsengisoli]|uniref:LacI family DNA-binding transcriptional regulator n=1 Tax=Gryllotalpicola ginsengisoli TaxID=444608 RepID=UPI0003B7B017|nr:LacI family DNA-binding transcriptional regulator [Gryllotalpicola ginsengisoli]